MTDLLAKLRRHPGTPIAAAYTLFGFIAGWSHGSIERGIFGALLMSVFWIPVLLTLPRGKL